MPSVKSIITTLIIALVAVAVAAQLSKKSAAAKSIFG